MGRAWTESHPTERRAAQRRYRRCRRQAIIDALPEDVLLAEATANEAEQFRRRIRRKAAPGEARNARIRVVLDQLADAARPLRPAAGLIAYGFLTADWERRLRLVSARLQRERAALRRMLR